MGAATPSKKQRGKKNAAAGAKTKKVKATTAAAVSTPVVAVTTATSIPVITGKSKHVKFNEDGEKVLKGGAAMQKKRALAKAAAAAAAASKDAPKEGGGKSDRSPEMIQQAKYYLDHWARRNEPPRDGELPWKFKKMKQMWLLRWLYEADVLPKSMFTNALEYLSGIQGQARQRVLDGAHEIIDAGVPERPTVATASDNAKAKATEDDEDLPTRLARRRYKRALQIAERLS